MGSHLLLSEILSRVFSFLHIEDKKNVRLVCSKWNESCNCPAITKTEKFVFRGGHDIKIINAFLKNCQRLRSTVEFQGLPLNVMPDRNTWRLCGPKIHSLSLIECELSDETTRNICLYCTSMHSFKLTSQFRHSTSNIISGFCSPETLDELIRLNIVRQKVILFQLFINGIEIPKEVLQRIFKIFPCIQNFGTGYTSFTSYIFQGIYHGSLDNIFNPALIKELSFNLPSGGLWLREFSNVPELKLQKLETVLRWPYFFEDVLSQFLRNQTELQTLKIRILGLDDDQTKTLLFKILSTCTKLTDFRFKCEVSLKMDEFFQVLQTVSQSKLECLVLWFKSLLSADDSLFDDDLSAYLAPSMNKTLRILKLDVLVPEEFCLPLLKHFANLNELELAAVTDNILQTIFQYHIHLRTLVLRKTDNCTAFGFTGRDAVSTSTSEQKTYSISRLRDLRHLELEGFLSYRWIERTVMEFNFPLLRYLRLSLWGLEEEISKRTFEYLPTVIPSVEILILNEITLNVHQYIYFCTHLRRLRLLLYNWIREDRDIKELFITRPSLKYAVDLSDNAYFYDRFTKELRIVNFRDIEFRRNVFCDFIRS